MEHKVMPGYQILSSRLQASAWPRPDNLLHIINGLIKMILWIVYISNDNH